MLRNQRVDPTRQSSEPKHRTSDDKLQDSVPDAARRLAIGKSTLWALIAAGAIATVEIGRRTFITRTEQARFVQSREHHRTG